MVASVTPLKRQPGYVETRTPAEIAAGQAARDAEQKRFELGLAVVVLGGPLAGLLLRKAPLALRLGLAVPGLLIGLWMVAFAAKFTDR